jgi:hypothetical protein
MDILTDSANEWAVHWKAQESPVEDDLEWATELDEAADSEPLRAAGDPER